MPECPGEKALLRKAGNHYYQIDLYFSCFAGIPSEIDLCTRMDSTKGTFQK